MIVVDSSALLAVLFKEPEKQTFQAILPGADRCVISAVDAHETACVLRLRHGQAMVEDLWRLLEENAIEIVPFDAIQVRAAAVALDRYGKGVDPKARLNLCDCAACALAKTINSPLLFKGHDFTATDVRPVVWPIVAPVRMGVVESGTLTTASSTTGSPPRRPPERGRRSSGRR